MHTDYYLEIKDRIDRAYFDFFLFRELKILFVTDEDGSYTPEHRFGLTEVIKALENSHHFFTRYKVVKAHRSSSGQYADLADKKGFRFDASFDPNEYDQIWFFGVTSTTLDGSSLKLTHSELEIVAKFMDGGGGVFATGDHEDLGQVLCGEIPRVRNMRLWKYDPKYRGNYQDPANYATGFPEDSDLGPPVEGLHRHDTLVPNTASEIANMNVPFDNQSDDVPATVFPKMYTVFKMDSFFIHVNAAVPHPVLCSPFGIINVMPDHMHEGHCVVPSDLNLKFKFGNYEAPEYPVNENGEKPVPEIICHAEVKKDLRSWMDEKDLGGGTVNDFDRYLSDVKVAHETFGSICVYNGHGAHVGRVLTDSTFHHFFNININGAGSHTTDYVKSHGFYASPSGEAYLKKIQAYFCNIARYLSRPENQWELLKRTLWLTRWDSQLKMLPSMRNEKVLSWRYHQYYGSTAFDIMGRFTSKCMSWAVYFELLRAIEPPFRHPCPWDPFIQIEKPGDIWTIDRTMLNRREVMFSNIAAVMNNIVNLRAETGEKYTKDTSKLLDKAIRSGLKTGIKLTISNNKEKLEATQKFFNKRLSG